jgi:hypothetical protein
MMMMMMMTTTTTTILMVKMIIIKKFNDFDDAFSYQLIRGVIKTTVNAAT